MNLIEVYKDLDIFFFFNNKWYYVKSDCNCRINVKLINKVIVCMNNIIKYVGLIL